MHCYLYDVDNWDVTAYKRPRFMSEFGLQSWPSALTMGQVLLSADQARDMFVRWSWGGGGMRVTLLKLGATLIEKSVVLLLLLFSFWYSFVLWQVFPPEQWSFSSDMSTNRNHHPQGQSQMAQQISMHFHLPQDCWPACGTPTKKECVDTTTAADHQPICICMHTCAY